MQITLIGDSHVKRMDFANLIKSSIKVRGVPGGGLRVVERYMREERNSDVLILMLGGNDICRHPKYPNEPPEITLTHVVTYLDNLQNFCNYVRTKFVLVEIISRDSVPEANQWIGMLNNGLREKFRAHFVDLRSERFQWLADKVHLTMNSYKDVACDLNVICNGPAYREDLVYHIRLCEFLTFIL